MRKRGKEKKKKRKKKKRRKKKEEKKKKRNEKCNYSPLTLVKIISMAFARGCSFLNWEVNHVKMCVVHFSFSFFYFYFCMCVCGFTLIMPSLIGEIITALPIKSQNCHPCISFAQVEIDAEFPFSTLLAKTLSGFRSSIVQVCGDDTLIFGSRNRCSSPESRYIAT